MEYVCLPVGFYALNMLKDLALLVFLSIYIGYTYGKRDAKRRAKEERKTTRRRVRKVGTDL